MLGAALPAEMDMARARRVVRPLGIAVVASIVGVMAPAPARAEGFLSPLIGYDFGGDSGCPDITGCENKHLNVGVSVGGVGRVIGTELELAYARNFFGDIPGASSSVLTFMASAMLAPRFGPVQPYALVGLGLVKAHVEFSATSLLDSTSNHFGWDVGGGLNVFPARHVGVRGDVRYFHAFQDLEILGLTLGATKLDFGRAAAGLVFRF
jgi:opacity protein-like surface antigen